MTPPRAARSDLPLIAAVWLPVLCCLIGVPFGTAGAAAGAAIGATAGFAILARHRRSEREAEHLLGRAVAEIAREVGLPAPQTEQPAELAQSLQGFRSVAMPRMAELERELTNLRAVLDATPSPVFATDASGEIVFENRQAQLFFEGRGPQIGRALEEAFTQAEVLGLHAGALAGTPRHGHVRIARPEGLRTFQILTAPVPLKGFVPPGKPGAIVVLRDITELAAAVQLKTDFVANASHELRTPLSSIRAAVETLADGAWADAPMRDRLVQMISSNVSRLDEMVRDLLDLSRLESAEAPAQLEIVHMSNLVEVVQDLFDNVAQERSLTITGDIEPEAEAIYTDGGLLQTILKNLVDNATKFAYEGTTVSVIARVHAAPGMERFGRKGLRIEVIDKGMGIPLGQQQRIFERFYQVDPARSGVAQRRGTGLGLAIVKHAVKALGGTIGVESVWRQGTTMIVELPGCVAPQA